MQPLPEPLSLGLTNEVIQTELGNLAAEAIGWQPLAGGVYLHVSDIHAVEVQVVGLAQQGPAVLLLT